MTEIAIVGGTLATEAWSGPASVLVSGGRIEAVISPETRVEADRVIDAAELVVLPGGVDPHCHIGQPLGDYPMRDDFTSGTLAALAGGTTTIIDFALPPQMGVHPLHILDRRLDGARDSRCDYTFHGCINPGTEDVPQAVAGMVERGLRTVKLFTTYRDLLMVDSGVVRQVMTTLKEHGGLTYVHAEANPCVEAAQAHAVEAGHIDASGMASTRPEACERDAVSEVLGIAEDLGAPVYFVHQSTPEAVDLCVDARKRGVRAFSETCPHYVTLDDSQYEREHPERWVCCPPLRSRDTVDALVRRVEAGFVDTVGSDHCCYNTAQKSERADDVRVMPNGLPGIETRLPVTFATLVASRRIGLSRFVQLTSTNAARLNGLYPQKGTLAPGSDADLVVIDPSASRTVSAGDLHMRTDYSPYDGRVVSGWPVHVLSRGEPVVSDGELHDPGPVGRRLEVNPIETSR